MAKAFSVMSWNVENIGRRSDPAKIRRAARLIKDKKPDLVAVYEVTGSDVFREFTRQLTNYRFFISEGPQSQEILVGYHKDLQVFITQRNEFKSGVALLRPGMLATVTVAGKDYPVLFLHTKSKNDPRGFGLRDDMLARALSFRKALDEAAGGAWKANYIFVGDLNTMGLEYPYDRDIDASLELKRLRGRASYRKMEILTKDEPSTWSNGSGSSIPPSDLDHVVAANHLKFKQFNGADVGVFGWPKETTTARQDRWIRDYSDHAYLWFEVQRA